MTHQDGPPDKPDTRVHDALRRIGPLPVLGGTVSRIRTLANDPHGTTTDLVAVIESDEAFSANLLRYANSAANARPIRARTIRQAVTLLGRRALVRIALEAETYRFLERFPGGAHLSPRPAPRARRHASPPTPRPPPNCAARTPTPRTSPGCCTTSASC